MNYAEIKKRDVANGPGVRVSLFVSGCTHRCKGCFNHEAWDFAYGTPFTAQTEQDILEALTPAYVQGLTLLGGDPLEKCNATALLPLVKAVRAMQPKKDIWCFTGETLEDIWAQNDADKTALLSMCDVLVDGPYVEEKRNISLLFRGSENQRLIDLEKTRRMGKIVLWEAQHEN